MGKRKKEDHTFLRKKNRKKSKPYYHNDIYSWKRDSLSSEVEIRRHIFCMKILKKRILKDI